MAAREYTIRLVNQTGYPLKLRPDQQGLDGEWSNAPPDAILPNQTGEWKSESDGVWQGTWGELRYQIQRTLGADDKQPPFPDLVFVHWKNPYYGYTRMWGNMEVDISAIPSSDRREPYNSPFAFEYTSDARDMGTYPGPASSGWLDIVPGVLPLPIPDVTIDHAWSQCRVYELPGRSIRPSAPIPSFIDLPPDTFTYLPVVDGPSEAWVGQWEYRDGPINRVAVDIARHSPSALYFGYTSTFDVSLGAKLSRLGSHLVLNQHSVRETQPVIEKYEGNVVVQTNTGVRVAKSPIAQVMGLKSKAKQLPGMTGGSPLDFSSVISANFTIANSLELTGDVTLCLYSRTEVHSGSHAYAIRFVRRTDSGKVLTDLMLDPSARFSTGLRSSGSRLSDSCCAPTTSLRAEIDPDAHRL